MKGSTEIVTAIDRALEIVEVLYRADGEMGITEIAKEMGEYQSTIYRALITLEQRDFVYQNPENSKFGLGMKLYAIGMVAGKGMDWLEIVKPYAKRLTDEFGENITVSVLDNTVKDDFRCIIVYQELVKGLVLGTWQQVGASSKCYYSSIGKALMAHSPECTEERIQQIRFEKYTENTITDWKTLAEELRQVRMNGYALDREEQEPGLFCVACPILRKDGTPVAAISVSGPSIRIRKIGIERIVKSLKEKTNEIGRLF